jgi:hypothetical protein
MKKFNTNKISNLPSKERNIPENKAVTSRNHLHKAAAVWCDKWLPWLYTLFASIGLFIVLLPAMIPSWQTTIVKSSLLLYIFSSYSTFTGISAYNFLLSLTLMIISTILNQKFAIDEKIVNPGYSLIIKKELYPKTFQQEGAYWFSIIFQAINTTTPLFLPFGVISFFITNVK